MEIFTLLETLEEMLETSKSIPFSNKGVIDKEEMLEITRWIKTSKMGKRRKTTYFSRSAKRSRWHSKRSRK